MNKILITVLFAGATQLAAAAGFMPWNDVLKMYDANTDGGVSMLEAKNIQLGGKFVGFQPFMVDHFAELDANKDGMISKEELRAMMTTKQWTDKQMVNQFYKNTGFMASNPQNQK